MMEEKSVITGVGHSAIGRRLREDPWKLTAVAALNAIADAGLSPDDIDGVSTYPGAMGWTAGITGAGVNDVQEMLGLRLRWYSGGAETPGQLGSLITAMAAIHAELANHVLVFRTVWESTAQLNTGSRSETMQQAVQRERDQWLKPYGVGYPTYGSMVMQRYMHESGATREQLGRIAVVSRAHARLNPLAAYRDPLSLDDYLGARMISDPLCLYDCDVPIDGAIAVIVSRADSVSVSRERQIRIAAIGARPGFEACAQHMWSRTRLTPANVDFAQLYDGFSILAIRWLEALGFCKPNAGASFVEDGERVSLLGDLPLNTWGGQLSGGRIHGFGGLLEACVQLRHEAGDRQVKGDPGIAVVSSGAESFASCLLLTKA
jgi:acetyl-CoA acetyltransferase